MSNIYIENGYEDRNHYLESLADEYCIDFETVKAIADTFGENEDFDGLVTTLQDMHDNWY